MYSQQVQNVDFPEIPKDEPKRLINIFDIDGCICKSLFPNVKDKKQTAAEIEELVSQVNETENPLYAEFVDYYINIQPKTFYNFFVTGRKVSHFHLLTEKQLSVLPQGNYFVKYFPEYREHTKRGYYDWKLGLIANLIKAFSESYSRTKPIIFRIFDDDIKYFLNLHYLFTFKESYFTTYHIHKPEHWDQINKRIYGRHFNLKHNLEEIFLE
jgi:hypothetical protein